MLAPPLGLLKPCPVQSAPGLKLYCGAIRSFLRGNLASLVLHLLRGEILHVIQGPAMGHQSNFSGQEKEHSRPREIPRVGVGLRNTKLNVVIPI